MLSGPFFLGTICSFVSVALCLLTGLILLLFSNGHPSRRYLGFFYLAVAYGFTTAALYYSGLIYHVPHLFRTGNFAWLIAMPLSWFYVRSVITPKPLNRWDLLSLLAVALFAVDYFPYFILSGAEKAEIYRVEVAHLDTMAQFHYGWLLPPHIMTSITYIQMLVYWVVQLRLLFSPQASSIRKQKDLYTWMITFTTLEIGLFFSFLLLIVFGFPNNVWISALPPTVAVVLSTMTLMLNPDILYGRSVSVSASPVRPKPTPDVGITKQISAQLETLMQQGKPFLDADYTLKQLADAIGVPSHKLSAHINQVIGSNFSEYLNQWRIRYCLEQMREGTIQRLNQHGIAAMCGFNNRKTFSAAFKKITGKLPSAFLHGEE
jgi:AraC-like DNA-binding protein